MVCPSRPPGTPFDYVRKPHKELNKFLKAQGRGPVRDEVQLTETGEPPKVSVGRFLLERKGKLDQTPLFDARSHLTSAKIAVQQGRLADAKKSADLAELRLKQMRVNFTAYGVKWR